MRINTHNYRRHLDDLGYYDGDTFEPEGVRNYLEWANLHIGENTYSDDDIDRLAMLAVDNQEHMDTDWQAARQAARDCGTLAAQQYTERPIPAWTGEPILPGDWNAIEEALGMDPAGLDSVATQELYDAWMDGYNSERCKED